MLVNQSNLSQIFINLKTTFNKAFEAAPAKWPLIAMEVPSTGKQNDYAWLANFPKMRKWVGDKVRKSLAAFKYTIVNDDWEATVEVDRNDILDDQLGIYAPQAQGAGFSAKQLPDELVFDCVNNAWTNLCYDGQYFIDVDHPVGDGNGGFASASNKITKALSAASQAAAIASLGLARTTMAKFKDDDGRPLDTNGNVLLVPPALQDVAFVLANNELLQNGEPNPYKGVVTVVVSARLNSDVKWYLLDTSKPVKPFIYQNRQAPNFVSQTDMNATEVFSRKKYAFGAEARAAAGYGFWQLCVGSDGTT